MISRKLCFLLTGNWTLALLLLALSACGSAPVRQPFAVEQAQKAEHEAHRALHDGDLPRARELFRQVLLMQQSLDNLPASATAAINLSSVSHKLGDTVTALNLLDNILADGSAQIPSELLAVAAFRKGVMLADAGKAVEAESALKIAFQQCNNQCNFVPGMNNLRARILLDKGDFASALEIASGVINAGAEKEEQANARRIAAAAETALGRDEAALAHYLAALELDKELAFSSRIAEDLKGAARMLMKLGRKAEAEIYARRAEAVIAAGQMISGKDPKKSLP